MLGVIVFIHIVATLASSCSSHHSLSMTSLFLSLPLPSSLSLQNSYSMRLNRCIQHEFVQLKCFEDLLDFKNCPNIYK